MGEPKLSLPFGSSTVIQHVICGLQVELVESVVVVVRGDDIETAQLASSVGAEVVQTATPPQDMRESVEVGLRFLLETKEPQRDDAWLLCPADCVGVSESITQALVRHWLNTPVDSSDVVVPEYQNRRGHPALFSWALVEKLFRLDKNLGVNALLRDPDVRVAEYSVDCAGVMEDVDTPKQYDAAVKRLSRSTPKE
jgi:molybdenum cofactor cytidylyltransferase